MRKIAEGRCRKQRQVHEEHHWYDAPNDAWTRCNGEPLFTDQSDAHDGHESVAGGNNA